MAESSGGNSSPADKVVSARVGAALRCTPKLPPPPLLSLSLSLSLSSLSVPARLFFYPCPCRVAAPAPASPRRLRPCDFVCACVCCRCLCLCLCLIHPSVLTSLFSSIASTSRQALGMLFTAINISATPGVARRRAGHLLTRRRSRVTAAPCAANSLTELQRRGIRQRIGVASQFHCA